MYSVTRSGTMQMASWSRCSFHAINQDLRIRRSSIPTFWSHFSHPCHLIFLSTNIGMLVQLRAYSVQRELESNSDTTSEAGTKNDRNDANIPSNEAIIQELSNSSGRNESFGPTRAKSTINQMKDKKRNLRAEKRFPDKMHRMRQNRELASKFLEHRSKVVHIFKDEDNIEALFKGSSGSLELRNVTNSYKQLKETLSPTSKLNYYDSDLKNSLLLVVHSFVNSVLVELNLRHLFLSPLNTHKRHIKEHRSALYVHLLRNLQDNAQKIEIIKLLTPLYTSNNSPENYQDFFRGLDFSSVMALIEDMKHSNDFNSLESRRSFFQFYKSSQHLNYEHSDLIKSVLATNYITFQSPGVNDSEYLQGFSQSFRKYDKKQELGHINLILGITRTLLSSSSYTPSLKIFQALLDGLGELKLYHYQSLVYQSLFLFKHKPTTLTGSKLSACHFQHLIEQHPAFLASLVRYQIPRGDVDTLKQLLSIYRLDEVIEHEKVLNRSFMADIMSKSRFYRSSSRMLGIKPVIFDTDTAIYTNVDSVYQGIKACIELGQYQYIDSLFNKLIVHCIQNNESGDDKKKLQVVLSFGSKPEKILQKSLMVGERNVVEASIFTGELFSILIRASRESDDMGRLMWLMPHLDNYITSRQGDIDQPLKQEIFKALTTFGLEGKLVTYDRLLDFAGIQQL
ncbi:uncharacterized protein RJT20DRAFT_127453 [Scheffersomyces xylosifermentans]|uniref:uncharacterized protein n=1 Tax=Scheffersomyces xylosifermentans TaxID=1304137 RepID=UPI00315D5065